VHCAVPVVALKAPAQLPLSHDCGVPHVLAVATQAHPPLAFLQVALPLLSNVPAQLLASHDWPDGHTGTGLVLDELLLLVVVLGWTEVDRVLLVVVAWIEVDGVVLVVIECLEADEL
jgi:hypothetical protein